MPAAPAVAVRKSALPPIRGEFQEPVRAPIVARVAREHPHRGCVKSDRDRSRAMLLLRNAPVSAVPRKHVRVAAPGKNVRIGVNAVNGVATTERQPR